MELNINSPKYYKDVYGVDDEIYRLCQDIYIYFKDKSYSEIINIIGIIPISAPKELLEKGKYKEVKHCSVAYGFADVNLFIDYEKYVEDKMDKMSESEKLNYYVNVKVNYIGRENYDDDDIIFLRNDNVYKGDLYDGDDSIGLPPGIYRVISEKVDGHQSNFGEISILKPGEDVTLNVDYNSYKASISSDEKTK